MRTKKYTIKQYLQRILLMLAGGYLCGCTAEQLIDEPTDEPTGWSEVRFFTSVATRAETLGTPAETLTDKAKVRLYPYRRKEGVTDPTLIKDYSVASQDGGSQKLSPVAPADASGGDATAMILPSGKFAFYAVTTNSEMEEVPEFHTGDAVNGIPSLEKGVATVKNGIDYLFAKTERTIAFGTDQTVVPLEFAHKGTQVQLTIVFTANACAPDAEAASNFAEATVEIQTTSETEAQMRLNDGQILSGNQTGGAPGNSSDLKTMKVEKQSDYVAGTVIPATQVATYHMLPLKAASTQKMDIKITIQNLKIGDTDASTRIYTGKLDASSGWLAGTSNRYTLTLSGTKIEFSSVTVVPWVNGSSGGEVGDVENKPSTAQITE